MKLLKKIQLLSNSQIAGILFLFSITITILFWLVLPGGFREDEVPDYISFYKPVGVNLLEGRGITLNNTWATRYPPGFPMIVAFFGGLSQLTTIPMQSSIAIMVLIFTSGSVVLLFLIGEKIWGKLGGILGSLLWLTYPIAIYLTKQPNSETPFIFFFLASIYLILISKDLRHRKIIMVFAGIFIGFAMLIRPFAIGLGVILAFSYWLSINPKTRSTIILGIMILFGNLLVIFPWEYVTYMKIGTVIPLSSNGVASLRLAFTYPVKLDGFREPFRGPEDVKQLANYIYDASSNITSSSALLNLIFQAFEKTPITFLKFIFIKLMRSWYGTDTGSLDRYILFIQIPYLMCILISGYLIVRHHFIQKSYFYYVVPILLYFLLMTLVGMPLVRYLLPVFPLLFLLIPVLINGKISKRLCKREYGKY
jgi:4-amino-4-deoxy-L-arabinose transferase-like glycosyltransferase